MIPLTSTTFGQSDRTGQVASWSHKRRKRLWQAKALQPTKPKVTGSNSVGCVPLVESGRERAERLLADRTEFVLGDADRRAFTAALDRPAQARPELARLFARPC